MPPRLKPTRLEHVVDGVRLRAQLSAAALDAAGDPAEQRAQAIEILKAALFRGRMIAMACGRRQRLLIPVNSAAPAARPKLEVEIPNR